MYKLYKFINLNKYLVIFNHSEQISIKKETSHTAGGPQTTDKFLYLSIKIMEKQKHSSV